MVFTDEAGILQAAATLAVQIIGGSSTTPGHSVKTLAKVLDAMVDRGLIDKCYKIPEPATKPLAAGSAIPLSVGRQA